MKTWRVMRWGLAKQRSKSAIMRHPVSAQGSVEQVWYVEKDEAGLSHLHVAQ